MQLLFLLHSSKLRERVSIVVMYLLWPNGQRNELRDGIVKDDDMHALFYSSAQLGPGSGEDAAGGGRAGQREEKNQRSES